MAAAAALMLGGALLVGGVAADSGPETHDVSVAACADQTKQLCTPVAEVTIATAGQLVVSFMASPTHCSSMIAHLSLDGVERYVSPPLAAGQETESLDWGPVEPGNHVLGVQAEGLVGGCNSGALLSWAGSLNVIRAPVAAPTPTPAVGPASSKDFGGTDYTPWLLLIVAMVALGGVGAWYLRRRPGVAVAKEPEGE